MMRDKHGHRIAFPFYAPEGAGSGAPAAQAGSGQQETAGGAENPAGAAQPGAETPPAAPQTFDDVLAGGYQSEFDRRVNKALQTARGKWEHEQQEGADEAAKLARMTTEQRERYQLDKERKTFAEQRAAFDADRLRVATGEALQKRGLSAEFAPYLVGKDAETSEANITAFEKLFSAALESGMTSRMRGGKVPGAPKADGITLESIKHMTPKEINAHWDEISKELSNK